jgi:hypothetical protein
LKSFLEGKRNATTEPLRAQTAAKLVRCSDERRGLALSVPGAAEAQVEVVKEGDKVVRLVVHCACGERIEVECLYPAGR